MKNAPSVPVLMYHHVTPKYSRLSVRSKGFESQIAAVWPANSCTVIDSSCTPKLMANKATSSSR